MLPQYRRARAQLLAAALSSDFPAVLLAEVVAYFASDGNARQPTMDPAHAPAGAGAGAGADATGAGVSAGAGEGATGSAATLAARVGVEDAGNDNSVPPSLPSRVQLQWHMHEGGEEYYHVNEGCGTGDRCMTRAPLPLAPHHVLAPALSPAQFRSGLVPATVFTLAPPPAPLGPPTGAAAATTTTTVTATQQQLLPVRVLLYRLGLRMAWTDQGWGQQHARVWLRLYRYVYPQTSTKAAATATATAVTASRAAAVAVAAATSSPPPRIVLVAEETFGLGCAPHTTTYRVDVDVSVRGAESALVRQARGGDWLEAWRHVGRGDHGHYLRVFNAVITADFLLC